jgi:hypothetical protein
MAINRQKQDFEKIRPARLTQAEKNVFSPVIRFWEWAGKALVDQGSHPFKRRVEIWMAIKKSLSLYRLPKFERTEDSLDRVWRYAPLAADSHSAQFLVAKESSNRVWAYSQLSSGFFNCQ